MTTPERKLCTRQSPRPKDAPGIWEHEGAKRVGECSSGCCDDYQCEDCGTRWRVEVPE